MPLGVDWIRVTDTLGKLHWIKISGIEEVVYSDADKATSILLISGKRIDISGLAPALMAILAPTQADLKVIS